MPARCEGNSLEVTSRTVPPSQFDLEDLVRRDVANAQVDLRSALPAVPGAPVDGGGDDTSVRKPHPRLGPDRCPRSCDIARQAQVDDDRASGVRREIAQE